MEEERVDPKWRKPTLRRQGRKNGGSKGGRGAMWREGERKGEQEREKEGEKRMGGWKLVLDQDQTYCERRKR